MKELTSDVKLLIYQAYLLGLEDAEGESFRSSFKGVISEVRKMLKEK